MYVLFFFGSFVRSVSLHPQYQDLQDPATRKYNTKSECSIFFEVDGPYRWEERRGEGKVGEGRASVSLSCATGVIHAPSRYHLTLRSRRYLYVLYTASKIPQTERFFRIQHTKDRAGCGFPCRAQQEIFTLHQDATSPCTTEDTNMCTCTKDTTNRGIFFQIQHKQNGHCVYLLLCVCTSVCSERCRPTTK